MVGQSPEFQHMLKLIEKISTYDVPVLIQGETGTGKELAARHIHYSGNRLDKPFVPVNCGGIPEQLFENELFGHSKGAFTDARDTHAGLISLANSGTLFLDEIDALSPHAQVSLLRFLQDQRYRPLGSCQEQAANVRIIAATNANLDHLCEEGKFRCDLLYRLKILSVEIPALRVRTGDPALLANHFLNQFSARFHKPIKPIHPETLKWFARHSWPGNIRELENLLCREFLLLEDNVTHVHFLPSRQDDRRKIPDRRLHSLHLVNYSSAKASVLNEFETRYLTNLLKSTNGNVTTAAKLAQLERRFLGKLIKKHNLDREQFSEDLRGMAGIMGCKPKTE
jgi:DNA-binding NtrC family response regulator